MFTRTQHERIEKKTGRKTVRGPRHRRLQTELLEDRTLMAGVVPGPSLPYETPSVDMTTPAQEASAVLDPDGTLRVFGTANDDHIKITEGMFQDNQWDLVPEPGIQVTIKDSGGQTLLSQTFLFFDYQNAMSAISTIKVYAGDGHDTVENNTAIASILYGGNGHDTLYGGLGNDELYGQAGNDGLFGGAGGSDYIDPGLGDNRILFVLGWNKNNYTWADWNSDTSTRTLITFLDSPAMSSDIDGYPQQPLTFQPGQWSLNEVKMIDQGMKFLHHKQGNSKLLGSNSLTIQRVGYQDPHSSGLTRTAWNDGTGNIFLTNNLFAQGPNWVTQTFLHEIGHNWDNENPQWQTFKDISGWTDSNPNNVVPNWSYATSHDGDWWYHTSATFARDYGRTNPMEDFATAFAAYCMQEFGLPFQGTWQDANNTIGWSVIPEKIAFIENWMFGMSSNYIVFIRAYAASDLLDRSDDTDMRDGGTEETVYGRVAASDTLAEPSDSATAVEPYRTTADWHGENLESRTSTDKVTPEIVDQALLELFGEDETAEDAFATLDSPLTNPEANRSTLAARR